MKYFVRTISRYYEYGNYINRGMGKLEAFLFASRNSSFFPAPTAWIRNFYERIRLSGRLFGYKKETVVKQNVKKNKRCTKRSFRNKTQI